MYRDGILPNGEPMQAYVQGDILVKGTMFSCESCHLRSGLGTAEGTKIVFPVNAAKLFIPLRRGAEIDITPARENLSKPFKPGNVREAYNNETLAMSIWSGIRPSGEELDMTMPRYVMSDDHMAIMVYYLNHLSAEFSNGVSDTEIQLATIVTEGVPQPDRDAMLLTLEAYLKVKNSQNRPQAKRAKIGPWYRQGRFTPYRKLVLSVWELKGPAETWTQQLEDYYSTQPVFALVGGMAAGEWDPIHQFCEKKGLPSIFPITDQPTISNSDWYTLYFSKGPYQEGIAAARFIRGTGKQKTQKVVQLIGSDNASQKMAEGFNDTWRKLYQPDAEEVLIPQGTKLDQALVSRLTTEFPNARFLAWLDASQMEGIRLLAESQQSIDVFASASLLGDQLYQMPEGAREKISFTFPGRLPEDRSRREIAVRRWLKVHNVPVIDMDIQGKVYFLGWMLSGGIKMMMDEYYQDYLLDSLDMMNDEYYSIMNYPRLSFGQGQRFAVKGCYIVKLGAGPQPKLIPMSDWVIQ